MNREYDYAEHSETRETVKDHEKRIRFLERAFAIACGFVLAIETVLKLKG